MSFLKDLAIALLAWLVLAVPGGIAAAGLWLAIRGRSLYPALRHRAVPWRELEVIAAVLTMLIIPPAIYTLLPRVGLLDWLYGPGFQALASLKDTNPEMRLAAARHLLWTSAIALPVQILAVLTILQLVSSSRLYHLGLHFRDGPMPLIAGYLFWLVGTPLILGLNTLVEGCFTWWHGKPPDPHDLTLAVQENTTAGDWALIAFTAVLAAPVFEELLFRGVLQRWLMRKSWGSEAAVVGALLMAMLAWESHGPAPSIFVLVMVPGFYYSEAVTWRWLPKLNLVRTIYGIALLFAAAHSNFWPTPVPLFFLGLALGWLAFRTQSLVAPIFFHALFNAVGCLQLALGATR